MTMAAGQSFFPGHEDIDKVHVASPDATYCTKCKMDLRGRGDLRIASDDAEEYKVLRRKNQLTDRMKKETSPMTQGNLLRALKQLYPGGPSSAPSVPSAIAQAESGQDAMRAMQAKLAAEQAMNQGIAQKMRALTPGQREAARQNAQKALAIALFHTDPRIHAHLLMDPANDVPETMDIALVTAWRTDLSGWRTQATERAAKVVAIMDGLGKASL